MENHNINLFPFWIISILTILLVWGSVSYGQKNQKVGKEDVLAAMRKASDYMVHKVSYNGGYLWYYTEDLSERFGEIPARNSQIWVQSGTPQMGEVFLDMYKATGDEIYLEYAKKAANALIYGQHTLGGWHYFIDFDKKGMQEWYENTASRFIVGWEEFRHYYGNCTYDDNVTQGATAFLMHLYLETLDPVYLGPLKKALNFILISQYPNGGWPQRYPLRYEFAHDGLPDYTSYYTLNDDAMVNTINVLLEAYEKLGDESYLEAAKRGGDFFMISQGPPGRAGWADQFDMNLQPAAGRTHEPASLQVRYTRSTINQLERLFLYTGDRRYLRPISAALDWMESVVIGIGDDKDPYFADRYDPKTNLPILKLILSEINEEGYIKYEYVLDTAVTYIEFSGKLPERRQYEKIRDVENDKERELYNELFLKEIKPAVDESEIASLVHSLNNNGVWIETIKVHDKTKTMKPGFEAVEQKGAYDYAAKYIRGFSTHTYMKNMRLFMDYLNSLRE